MKIVTLVENNSISDKLKTEQGLSLYIEVDNHKILFGTGRSDLFIKNAEELKIVLTEVDTVVISNGHSDQIGGLIHFLKLNQNAKVYLKKEIFDYYNLLINQDEKTDIEYLSVLLDYKDRFMFLRNACTMLGHLVFITNFDKNYKLSKTNILLNNKAKNSISIDDFQHELIFSIKTEKGLTIFSGCSHKNILNVVSTVQRFLPALNINNVIGGFNLSDNLNCFQLVSNKRALYIGKELNRILPKTNYYTGYCTGDFSFNALSDVLESKLNKIEVGHKMVIL